MSNNKSHPLDNPQVANLLEIAATSGQWITTISYLDSETKEIKVTSVSHQYPALDISKTKAMIVKTLSDIEIVKTDSLGIPLYPPNDPNGIMPPAQ